VGQVKETIWRRRRRRRRRRREARIDITIRTDTN
jgi:hypothetical protein